MHAKRLGVLALVLASILPLWLLVAAISTSQFKQLDQVGLQALLFFFGGPIVILCTIVALVIGIVVVHRHNSGSRRLGIIALVLVGLDVAYILESTLAPLIQLRG